MLKSGLTCGNKRYIINIYYKRCEDMEMEVSAVSAGGVNLLYTETMWTGKRSLIVDGVPTIKIGKKKFMSQDESGNRTEYEIIGSYFSGITVCSSTGEKTVLAKNAWYDWVMAFLPIIGVPFGIIFCGAIGGGLSALCCVLGAFVNIWISRTKIPLAGRIAIQFAVAVVANCIWFGAWYVIAVILLAAVGAI